MTLVTSIDLNTLNIKGFSKILSYWYSNYICFNNIYYIFLYSTKDFSVLSDPIIIILKNLKNDPAFLNLFNYLKSIQEDEIILVISNTSD